MVVFHHFVGYHALSPARWAVDIGNIAVGWFFILSGFILAYNFPVLSGSEAKIKFIVSRFWRLFPVQAVTVLMSIAIFSSSRSLVRVYPADLLQSLTLTHTWAANPFASQAFNVPAWSISVEWFFYIIFPLLIAMGWLGRALLAFAAFVVAATWAHAIGCFSSQANFQAPGDSFHATCYQLLLYWPPARLWEFTLGIALCGLSNFIKRSPGASAFVQFALMLVAVWIFFDRWTLISLFYSGFYSSFFSAWLITVFSGATLILALSLPGPIGHVLSFFPLVFLGEVSFSVYMTHMLILRFADMHQIAYTLPISVQFVGIYAVATLVSTGLFLWVEKPSRLMLKNFLKRPITAIPGFSS
jgi:peptidoglycan/LPS O-acetylase OafA/YrhL